MESKRIIVVAVDGSDCSSVAFDWAVDSVCRPEDEFHILHVRPPASAFVPHDFTVTGENSDYYAAVEETILKRSNVLVRTLEEKAKARGLEHVCPVSLAGEAREEICAYLADVHADIVIVGSRGLGFVRRAMLGSVSAYVSKHAPCAVLIVKETLHSGKKTEMKVENGGSKRTGSDIPVAVPTAGT